MADLRLLIFTHLAVATTTYALTDRRPIDTEVSYEGFAQITKKTILSATVESLRNETNLRIMSYKGTASVETERRWLWLFGGHQELSVPGTVSYHLDLSKMSLRDVSLDESGKFVTVRVPRVALGEISLQPENATTLSGGPLSWDNDQVEALRKLNFQSARRALVAQAQQPGLLNAAKRQAQLSVAGLFEIPLRAAGWTDVTVIAVFDTA